MFTQFRNRESYPFWFDVGPLLLTALILGVQFFIFKDFTPHIPLIIGICLTGIFSFFKGRKWADLETQMFKVMRVGLPAILILMCVGMLISIWIAAGTVPTIVNYGLDILTPGLFLPVTCALAAIISLSTGTSWGTLGTVGLALMAIGNALNIPIYWTAGAVVSGSFFGDKMSPLSETTNLSPAIVGGIDLWDHIKGVLPTTIPAMGLALIIYAIVSRRYGANIPDMAPTLEIQNTMQTHFKLGLLTLIPALSVVYMGYKKYSAMGTICLGVLLGSLIAIFYQGIPISEIFGILQNGYISETGVAYVDDLLSKGGVMSMTWVITLTLFALAFAGSLEYFGTFDAIMTQLDRVIKSRISLIGASYASVLGVSTILGDVYTSLVLPGRLLRGKYRSMGYKRTTLTRTMEDCGTLASPLIPWNMGGSFVASTLGVPTLLYAPFALFCWLSPLFGIFWALTGWFVPRAPLPSAEEEEFVWDRRKKKRRTLNQIPRNKEPITEHS